MRIYDIMTPIRKKVDRYVVEALIAHLSMIRNHVHAVFETGQIFITTGGLIMSKADDVPRLTADLAIAKEDLDRFGYCLIANAVGRDEVLSLRKRLEAQAAAEKQSGFAHEDAGANGSGVNQRVWFLVNKGKVFRDLLVHDLVRELVPHILGERFVLSSFTANIAKPGGLMAMHTDQWWMPCPTNSDRKTVKPGSMTAAKFRGRSSAPLHSETTMWIPPAVACNVMWMLTDFTMDNGATHVVPASHLSGRQPDVCLDEGVSSVAVEAPGGTAMVFDGRLWHSTGANISSGSRLGVLSYFCAPQFRQQENLTVGTDPKILKEASRELMSLLGFKLWQGYGRIESPQDEFILPGQTSLGELSPK